MTSRDGGSGGSSRTRAAIATRPRTPTAPKAARQPPSPSSSPRSVPAGTPRTDAVGTPPKTSAVARPTCRSGTSRTAIPPASAQKPPTLIPTSRRAASSTAKSGARAAARLAAAIRAMSPHSTSRRSIRPAPTATSGAQHPATSPGTVTMSPAVPSDTPSASPTGVSRPTGSSSEVIRQKIPSATADTAAQPFQPMRSGSGDTGSGLPGAAAGGMGAPYGGSGREGGTGQGGVPGVAPPPETALPCPFPGSLRRFPAGAMVSPSGRDRTPRHPDA